MCLTLALAAISQQWSGTVSAQATDPLTLPRLSFSDVTYLGGFRLPRTLAGGDDTSYGGNHMAFNPARNSLFVNSLRHNVAEVSIPTPVNTNDVNQMPFASYLQPFSDPSEGHFKEIENGGPNGAVLAGLVVHGNRLYATGSIYYDAQNSQVVSHFSHSTNLSEPSYVGMSQVWETGKAGYVGGYMATIPSEWHSQLGGPALTGQCCIPIIMRTSFGPAAFAWDPATIGNNTAVPATPLLYYTSDHTTLGAWASSNEVYGGTTLMGGAAVIAGTRTALFIGRNGLGTYCYGHGVTDPALDGQLAVDGVLNCYDPASSDKGMHAYPYRYQIWAYDLADFAAVKAGTKQPWQVVPYGVWPFELPTTAKTVRIGGVAYDAQRQLLYVAQFMADQDGYSFRPIVHTLKINAPSSTAPPPLPTISTVSATPSVAAPQALGGAITWAAAATGGTAPYEYKWFASSGGVTTMLRDWSASPTYTWLPTAAALDWKITVWARSAGSIASTFEAKAEYPFAITDIETDGTPVKILSLALAADLPAPQPVSTSVTWTAISTAGSSPLVYKWLISNDGATWNAIGSWTSSNQFVWTPTTANPNYRVAAWVKHASNPADAAEASADKPFPIGDPASSPVTAVTLSSNVPSPQAASSTIVWTATPTGGTGTLSYRWWVSSDAGASWSPAGPWSGASQFTWMPTVAGANYRVAVWVKRASNTADTAEAYADRTFAITDDRPVASVTLASNLASPQPVSTAIQWTATPTGGTGALTYRWWVSNDGGASWTPAGPWSSASQFTWTPSVAGANYRVAVWVKRTSNAADTAEAYADQAFAVTDRPVTSVTLSSNLASPQSLSTSIQWTAAAAGGTGSIVYRYWVSNDGGASWTPTGPWTASNQLTWTPAAAGSNYRVAVWAKRASNTADTAEAYADQAFAITDNPVTNVTLTSNLASPQPLSTTIQWTATPAGGTGSIIYRFWVSNDGGASWAPIGTWTASNQLTWTPAAAGSNYRVAVWATSASNTADTAEAYADRTFAITDDRPVASVALTSNLASPQSLSTPIQWTATPAGGTGSIVYRFWVSNNGGASWAPIGSWTASNQLTWSPAAAGSNYRIAVWAKRASNTADTAEAYADKTFAITDSPVISVSLTSDLASPQPLPATIQWTAAPAGGSGALLYQWFISSDDGVSWTAIGAWTLSNRLTWTPTSANPKYRVAVWVKRATNPSPYPEAGADARFAITGQQ